MEVTRELVLPAPREEVWEALTDQDRLEDWFANDVELDLETGEGVFRWENGEVRRAVVEDVELERRLAIRWWDPEQGGAGSAVVFTLEEVPEGTRLIVTETATGPQACAGEWSWAVSLQAMPFGFWPAITLRAAPLRRRQSRRLHSWAGSVEPTPVASSVAANMTSYGRSMRPCIAWC